MPTGQNHPVNPNTDLWIELHINECRDLLVHLFIIVCKIEKIYEFNIKQNLYCSNKINLSVLYIQWCCSKFININIYIAVVNHILHTMVSLNKVFFNI